MEGAPSAGEPQVDGLLARVTLLWEMLEGTERLLEVPAASRWADRARPSPPPAGSMPGPWPRPPPAGHDAPGARTAQPPGSRERLEGLDDPGMQPASALLEDTPIGHLMGEGMLEGVLTLGEQACLVEELSSLDVGEAAVEALRGHLDNGLQQGQRHFMANHGRGLEEALGLGGSRSMRAASTACTVAGT